MNEQEKTLHSAGTMVVYLTVGFGVFALIEFISRSPLWSEKGAAWVQAIGSILAIGSAVFIMKRQSEHAERLAIEMDSRTLGRRLAALDALVGRALKISENVEVHIEGVADYDEYFLQLSA